MARIDKNKLLWKIFCHCNTEFYKDKSPAKCPTCGQWYILPKKKALQNLKKDLIQKEK